MMTLLLIAAFLILVGLIVTLRSRTEGKYDVKTSDVIAAAVPILLGLIATGKLDALKIGPQGFEVKRALQDALSKPALHEIKTELPVEKVATATRGQVQAATETEDRVRRLIQDQVQALIFFMGKGHNAASIQVYFRRLLPQPFFRYVVINGDDGRYFGLIPAQSILDVIAQEKETDDQKSFAGRFAALLNSSDRANLRKIAGFMEAWIDARANKLSALRVLNKENLSFLPVVRDGKFEGIADRARIVASVLVDVSDDLMADSEKRGK